MRPLRWLILVPLIAYMLSAEPGWSASAASPVDYRIFLQYDWMMSTKKGLSPRGNLVFRRYGYRQDLNYVPNLMLFTCQRQPEYFNYLTIIVPKEYSLKSISRHERKPKMPIRIMADGRATYNLIGDYNQGEIAIDRTPKTSIVFDLIMDAHELSIGFGIGDIFRFYPTSKMDAFLKEASVAAGIGVEEAGDVSFVDRPTMYQLCAAFQSGR